MSSIDKPINVSSFANYIFPNLFDTASVSYWIDQSKYWMAEGAITSGEYSQLRTALGSRLEQLQNVPAGTVMPETRSAFSTPTNYVFGNWRDVIPTQPALSTKTPTSLDTTAGTSSPDDTKADSGKLSNLIDDVIGGFGGGIGSAIAMVAILLIAGRKGKGLV